MIRRLVLTAAVLTIALVYPRQASAQLCNGYYDCGELRARCERPDPAIPGNTLPCNCVNAGIGGCSIVSQTCEVGSAGPDLHLCLENIPACGSACSVCTISADCRITPLNPTPTYPPGVTPPPPPSPTPCTDCGGGGTGNWWKCLTAGACVQFDNQADCNAAGGVSGCQFGSCPGLCAPQEGARKGFLIFNDINENGLWDAATEPRIAPSSCSTGGNYTTVNGFGISLDGAGYSYGTTCNIQNNEAPGPYCTNTASCTANGGLGPGSYNCSYWGPESTDVTDSCFAEHTCRGNSTGGNICGYNNCQTPATTRRGALCNTGYCDGADNLKNGSLTTIRKNNGTYTAGITIPTGWRLSSGESSATKNVNFNGSGGRNDVCNGELVTFGVVPNKSCFVDVINNPGGGANVRLVTQGYTGFPGDQVSVYLTKVDGASIGSLPQVIDPVSGAISNIPAIRPPGSPYYYYKMGTCNGPTCTAAASAILPAGNYIAYCGNDTNPGWCAGNPHCPYESGRRGALGVTVAPEATCGSARSCDGINHNMFASVNAYDNKAFTVTGPPPLPVTVEVFQDDPTDPLSCQPDFNLGSGYINYVDTDSLTDPSFTLITDQFDTGTNTVTRALDVNQTYTFQHRNNGTPLQVCSPGGSLQSLALTSSSTTSERTITFIVSEIFDAWFQAMDGDIAANLGSIVANVPPTCALGPCLPHVMLESTEQSQGVIQASTNASNFGSLADADVTQKLVLSTENYLAEDVGPAIDTSIVPREDFDYFMRLFEMPETPRDDWQENPPGNWGSSQVPSVNQFTLANVNNAVSPTTLVYYYDSTNHAGNPLTYDGDYHGSGNQNFYTYDGIKVVIFVKGDLVLKDFNNTATAIQIINDGFLSFIVSDNIIIEDTVGNDPANYGTTNIQGIFVAGNDTGGGTIDVQPGTLQLGAKGTYVGWGGVTLGRDLLGTDNNQNPAELFVYDPLLIMNAPDEFRRSRLVWQEVAPFDFGTLPAAPPPPAATLTPTSTPTATPVPANTAPSAPMQITSHTDPNNIPLGEPVTIRAIPFDPEGHSITRVRFYANASGGPILATDLTAPFEYTFTPTSAGITSRYAVATDELGANTAPRAVISFTVVNSASEPGNPCVDSGFVCAAACIGTNVPLAGCTGGNICCDNSGGGGSF